MRLDAVAYWQTDPLADPAAVLVVTDTADATAVGEAAARMRWPVLVEPTPRTLMVRLRLRRPAAVVVGVGDPPDPMIRRLALLHHAALRGAVVAAADPHAPAVEQTARSAGVSAYLAEPSADTVIRTVGDLLTDAASLRATARPALARAP